VPWKGARTPGGGAEVTGAACDEELAGTYVIRLAEPRRRPARRCACASPASHDLPKASAEARAERSRPSARSSSGVDVQRPARRGGDTCPSPLPRPRRARILATILVLLRVCTRLEIAGALAARVARRDGRLLAGQRPFIQACGSIPAAILPPLARRSRTVAGNGRTPARTRCDRRVPRPPPTSSSRRRSSADVEAAQSSSTTGSKPP
jgi:hypothetical protein